MRFPFSKRTSSVGTCESDLSCERSVKLLYSSVIDFSVVVGRGSLSSASAFEDTSSFLKEGK